MAVPVMAVRVSDPGAVDDQEEKWAQAVFWNELIDKIDELPDAATFIQTFSMAVVSMAVNESGRSSILSINSFQNTACAHFSSWSSTAPGSETRTAITGTAIFWKEDFHDGRGYEGVRTDG